MIYTDLEHAEELGKTLICVPIETWKYFEKIRVEYPKLKQQVRELRNTVKEKGSGGTK